MEKKRTLTLISILLIFASILILVMCFFIYTLYMENITATKEIERLTSHISSLESTLSTLQERIDGFSQNQAAITLKTGNYTVNEVSLGESGVSNEDCGVTLKENHTFIIYMGWGVWHSGEYEITGSTLICKSTLLEWDGGGGPGSRQTNVIFTFDILSDNKLELSNIEINDPDNEKLVYTDGLMLGMTYSIK